MYGVRGIALKWFKSYLNNRFQYVVYNGQKSDKKMITCGVPQGSILGPLLFLLYINDLADVSDKLFALLFADDSNMFISGSMFAHLHICNVKHQHHQIYCHVPPWVGDTRGVVG